MLMATGSYRLIEMPLRQAQSAQRKQSSILYGTSCVISALVTVKALARLNPSNLFVGDLAAEEQENQRAAASGTSISGKNCSWWMGDGPLLADAIKNCSVNRNRLSTKNIQRYYILGDSHAGNMMGWVESVAYQKNIFVQILYVHGQSAPLIQRQYASAEVAARRADESQQAELIENTLAQLRQGDTLILSNYLLVELIRKREPLGRADLPIKDPGVSREWLLRLEQILSRSKAAGAQLVLVLPLPDFKLKPRKPDLRICVQQWYRIGIQEGCLLKTSRKAIANDIKSIRLLIASGRKDLSALYIYNPFNLFCGEELEYCTNYRGDKRTFLDGNHLNGNGARVLAPDFTRFLKAHQLMRTSQ